MLKTHSNSKITYSRFRLVRKYPSGTTNKCITSLGKPTLKMTEMIHFCAIQYFTLFMSYLINTFSVTDSVVVTCVHNDLQMFISN